MTLLAIVWLVLLLVVVVTITLMIGSYIIYKYKSVKESKKRARFTRITKF